MLLLALLSLCPPARGDERADRLIADFEQEDYGEWKVTGDAFGPGPARGTLPNQMHVEGYRGERLVNSFFRGDGTTGTLTSPAVKIERKYINFLIGGGGNAGETCINLLVDGETVRTATGPNAEAGGSERLDWHTWEVAEFEGKPAVIEIVDRHRGGWGHINVDHIVQSDRKLQAEPASREILVNQRYLHLPVKTDAPKRRMRFVVDGQTEREFDIELAEQEPDFHVFADVRHLVDRRVAIQVDRWPADAMGLEAIAQSDELPDQEILYAEKHRPQFHFTSRRGWLNDPNGLVYHNGEYHLFYQHNPYGWNWGNMHWGHAVSTDLVHWRELPIALAPRQYGDWAFSGSAVVDERNTAGFRTGEEPVLVAAYTSTGRGESIAYSNDRGRTWADYEGNPVVRHRGRDPKLLWHEPTNRWVMAVYTEVEDRQAIAFYTSPDLKTWEYQSRIDGFYECPDLFELPVDGNVQDRRWILYAADGEYLVGRFDGRSFHAESGKHRLWHGNFYAAQTFNNAPDDWRIQIGWGRGVTFPGMPFNQQMTFPVELTLRTTDDGIRMFAEPVPEIRALRKTVREWADLKVTGSDAPRSLPGIAGELLEIVAELHPGTAEECGLIVGGVSISYNAAKRELSCRDVVAPLVPQEGAIRLHVLADRGSIEVFGNRGRVALSVAVIREGGAVPVTVFARGGTAEVRSLTVVELKSAWLSTSDDGMQD